MKKAYRFILLFIIAFASCTARLSPVTKSADEPRASQTVLPSATQSSMPTQTTTVSPTVTVKPSLTATVIPTKTPTITPVVETYPLKQVWIEFGPTQKGLADFEAAFPLTIPNWVLYTDGTLIVYQSKTFLTKQLTESEICALLTRIEQLGFYQIKTDGGDYQHDPIYVNVPPDKLWTDDAYEYLVVNGSDPKTLWVYDPIKDYAIQKVKNIMNSLRNYAPTGLQPYHPDRLGLFVQRGRPYDASESLKANPWPADATPIINRNEYGSMYLEGEMAARVYEMFKKPYTWLIFTEKEQEYTIRARPLLPHESRANYGVDNKSIAEFEPPFICK